MKKRWFIYLIITLVVIFLSLLLLSAIDRSDSFALCKAIQIIIILLSIRISIGCTFFIKDQYEKQKYSYGIIMNLGLLIFININIIRMLNLLLWNWNQLDMVVIFNHTLKSFSFFAMLILPCIIILSIYSIITNAVLIQKEGFHPTKLLGIILGIFALFGLFGSQGLYYLISGFLMRENRPLLKYSLDLCINGTLSYFYTLIVATLYCNIRAAKHIPKYDKDFVIILGSRINGDGTLTPLLKGRVDKAISFGEKQYELTKKKIVYVPSGGQGSDEVMAEAQAITNYLLEKGIQKDQILIEDQSTSTIENMKFSKDKIDQKKKNAKISFSTTSYHVFRSGVIANEQGIDVEGMGSKTKWYFYSNALIREFVANVIHEKYKHLALLILINFFLISLIFIGRYFHLIVIV